MIKSSIRTVYPHHNIVSYNDNLFIADYTELTKNNSLKRSVEIFSNIPPTDNSFFSISNINKLDVDSIIFDNNSFKHTNGKIKPQCEATVFPSISDHKSWILFVELKYSCVESNNERNINKAIKQLLKTRYHYIQYGVYNKHQNTSYLIASLPLQREPFPNFSLTASYLSLLKTKHNIVLRLKNSVEILDSETLIV